MKEGWVEGALKHPSLRVRWLALVAAVLLGGCTGPPVVGEPRWRPQPLNEATLKQLGLTPEQTQRGTAWVLAAVEKRHADYDPAKPLLYAIDPTRGRFAGTLWVFVPLRDRGTQRKAYEAYAVSLHEESAKYCYSTHLPK